MFTGLIEQSGQVADNIDMGTSRRLCIDAQFEQLQTGESIAINGVCLTLLPGDHKQQLAFDLSPETLAITNLNGLQKGDSVNIERSMLASSRIGGHYVSGHVDTTAVLKAVTPINDYLEMTISEFAMPAEMYLIPKGSIAIDGVSLTINEVMDGSIKLMLIPHTLSVTTLGRLQVGQRVNIEFDYMTRIIAHQLAHVTAPASGSQ